MPTLTWILRFATETRLASAAIQSIPPVERQQYRIRLI
jgi:hypothetical protein